MSLESKIEALTAAVVALTAQLQNAAPQTAAVTVPQAPAPVAAPAPAPVPTFAAVPEVAPAPVMPAPPTFAPTAAPAVAVPFSDQKGLIEFVMGAYKELGPDKGAQIQNILTSLGVQNINDVKPEQYPALFQGVNALKTA